MSTANLGQFNQPQCGRLLLAKLSAARTVYSGVCKWRFGFFGQALGCFSHYGQELILSNRPRQEVMSLRRSRRYVITPTSTRKALIASTLCRLRSATRPATHP
jgi:hypothetical protein